MDFLVDTYTLCDLVTALFDDIDEIDTTISQIYEGIDALSEGWQSESYMIFREKAYSYQSSLNAMVDAIRVFKNVLTQKLLLVDIDALKQSLKDADAKLGGE